LTKLNQRAYPESAQTKQVRPSVAAVSSTGRESALQHIDAAPAKMEAPEHHQPGSDAHVESNKKSSQAAMVAIRQRYEKVKEAHSVLDKVHSPIVPREA